MQKARLDPQVNGIFMPKMMQTLIDHDQINELIVISIEHGASLDFSLAPTSTDDVPYPGQTYGIASIAALSQTITVINNYTRKRGFECIGYVIDHGLAQAAYAPSSMLKNNADEFSVESFTQIRDQLLHLKSIVLGSIIRDSTGNRDRRRELIDDFGQQKYDDALGAINNLKETESAKVLTVVQCLSENSASLPLVIANKDGDPSKIRFKLPPERHVRSLKDNSLSISGKVTGRFEIYAVIEGKFALKDTGDKYKIGVIVKSINVRRTSRTLIFVEEQMTLPLVHPNEDEENL